MRKIPTLFVRDEVNRQLVTDVLAPGCEWVSVGEGVATRKIDGVCVMIRDGHLHKRYELKPGKSAPSDWEPADDVDHVTGKQMGWVPVREGDAAKDEDRWMLEALTNTFGNRHRDGGTYEFVGPKSQGNVEKFEQHALVRHGKEILANAPRTFEALRGYFTDRDIEGIVFHHEDGRMVKIKKKDFGLKRLQ